MYWKFEYEDEMSFINYWQVAAASNLFTLVLVFSLDLLDPAAERPLSTQPFAAVRSAADGSLCSISGEQKPVSTKRQFAFFVSWVCVTCSDRFIQVRRSKSDIKTCYFLSPFFPHIVLVIKSLRTVSVDPFDPAEKICSLSSAGINGGVRQRTHREREQIGKDRQRKRDRARKRLFHIKS